MEILTEYWGGLGRAAASLVYSISGGEDWGRLAGPFWKISAFHGVVYMGGWIRALLPASVGNGGVLCLHLGVVCQLLLGLPGRGQAEARLGFKKPFPCENTMDERAEQIPKNLIQVPSKFAS